MTPVPSDSAVAPEQQCCGGNAGGPATLGRGDRDLDMVRVARAGLLLLRYVSCTCHLRKPVARKLMRDHHAVDCPLVLVIRLRALAQEAGVEPYASRMSLHNTLNLRGILCASD